MVLFYYISKIIIELIIDIYYALLENWIIIIMELLILLLITLNYYQYLMKINILIKNIKIYHLINLCK
jgi:hypothetical protein